MISVIPYIHKPTIFYFKLDLNREYKYFHVDLCFLGKELEVGSVLKKSNVLKGFTAVFDPEFETGPPGGGQPGQYDPNDGYVTGRSSASLADAKTTAYRADDSGPLIECRTILLL
ncbi:MAG: hypothetical protein QXL38_01415 [Candidatus Bathyarchaeia archaeon]